jgi:CBS domain containing-hemolysin-like protein
MPTVAATDSLPVTLDRMRDDSAHLARVADEHGTTLGVVALVDVLVELIGDVHDGAAASTPEVVDRLPTSG